MAEGIDKVKKSINEIAGRVNNVTLSDIENVMSQLGQNGYAVKWRPAADHAVLFSIDSLRFSVCTHNRGSKQLKAIYVKKFLRTMIELELYG